MPYARPTLTDLVNQALADITTSDLPGVDGLLKKAVLRVMAYVQAGFAYLHYGFLDYISLQSVPYTSTDEYLAGWGALIGVAQLDATIATGPQVSFTGNNGVDLPSGSAVVRGDGYQFTTTADGIVTGGTVTVPIAANTAGAAGNTAAGSIMILASPINGIQSIGTATKAITGGSDQETQDAYKTRVLAQYAAPPQGGDLNDYVEWAVSVPGVTRAWVVGSLGGPGTVTVFTMFDSAESAFGGFPQGSNGVAAAETRAAAATGDQLAVANYIFPLRPATALVYSDAPTAQPVAFTVANLGANNTTAMQALISAALTQMFLSRGYVGGTSNPASGAPYTPLSPSDWYGALDGVAGLTEFTVSVPSGPIAPATGSLLTVGAITFVT